MLYITHEKSCFKRDLHTTTTLTLLFQFAAPVKNCIESAFALLISSPREKVKQSLTSVQSLVSYPPDTSPSRQQAEMAGQYIEHGGGRPWHKRVLIPFWLIQLLFIIIQIGVAAFRIWENTGTNIKATTIDNPDGTRTVTSTVNGITATTTQSANGTVISGDSQVSITNSGTIIA